MTRRPSYFVPVRASNGHWYTERRAPSLPQRASGLGVGLAMVAFGSVIFGAWLAVALSWLASR